MRTGLFILLCLAALYGSYQFFKPTPDSANITPSSRQASKSFTLEIANGQVIGTTELKVKLGQQIKISVISSSPDELHLHGYDINSQLQPAQQIEINLHANKAGRFPLELHKAHREIAVLLVQP